VVQYSHVNGLRRILWITVAAAKQEYKLQQERYVNLNGNIDYTITFALTPPMTMRAPPAYSNILAVNRREVLSVYNGSHLPGQVPLRRGTRRNR